MPISIKSWIALLVSICPAPRTMPGSEPVLNIYEMKLVYIQQREKICGVGMKKGGIRSNNSNLFSNIILNGTCHHTSKEIHMFLFSKCDALNTQSSFKLALPNFNRQSFYNSAEYTKTSDFTVSAQCPFPGGLPRREEMNKFCGVMMYLV